MTLSLNLDSRSLVTQIADTLRNRIVRGELEPGARIRQDEYAEAFGVSRTPLREAFRLLEAEGWIQIRPRSGVEVSRFSRVEAQEILVMRLLLEPLATRIGAVTHDTAQERLVRKIFNSWPADTGRDLAQIDAYDTLNQRFHYALYGMPDGTSQDPIHVGLRGYWERYLRYRRVYYWRDPDSTSNPAEEHSRILQAWTARDGGEAEVAMAHHILGAGKILLRSLDDGADQTFTPALRELADRYDIDLT